MTNEELLEHIGKVIDAKLDEKLEPINKRLDTVEKNIATKDDLKNMATKTDVHEITEDMAGFFHKTWEKMDETNERVTIIEDQLDIHHPEEN
jgi:hypothetical protein